MASSVITNLKDYKKKIYQKENLLIRPLRIEDVKKNYIQSLQDKEINKHLISKKKNQLNKDSINKYVSYNYSSSRCILFGIFFEKKHIGNCRIHYVNKELFLGIAIFDKLYQNKGLGSKVIKIISNFAFKILNIHYIQAKIYNRNKNSIKAFTKAGFKIKEEKKIKNNEIFCLVIKKK